MNPELEKAEVAIARGDYGQCLTLLEPLAKKLPSTTKEGGEIRMLMITAMMGRGEEQAAITTCKLMTQCKNHELRERAKQLLAVLEAPSLQRPKNWSVRLPSMQITGLTGKHLRTVNSKKRNHTSPPLPPTGPTQYLGFGFSLFVLTVLIALTFLLSGYIQMAPIQASTFLERISV